MHDFSQTFPRAHGAPLSTGTVKQSPDDFVVSEQLSFPFTGNGEHLYLHIRKRQTNTQWVIKQLARHFGCPARDIGYAGLKDRQAVTTQWFSLPGKYFSDAKANQFNCDEYQILAMERHQGKLRRGAILQNHFTIYVRDINSDPAAITQRMTDIERLGVPNYFGEQRFGINRNNLTAADKWCQHPYKLDRFKRGIYLSAMRGWLFNLVVAERIRQDNWCQPVTGDIYALEGSKRFFYEDAVTDVLQKRMRAGDIHPSAPLWGADGMSASDAAQQIELAVLKDWADWRSCLERADLKQERRALRVMPRELSYAYDEAIRVLQLRFALPAGSYATGLISEIVTISSGELELTDE